MIPIDRGEGGRVPLSTPLPKMGMPIGAFFSKEISNKF